MHLNTQGDDIVTEFVTESEGLVEGMACFQMNQFADTRAWSGT